MSHERGSEGREGGGFHSREGVLLLDAFWKRLVEAKEEGLDRSEQQRRRGGLRREVLKRMLRNCTGTVRQSLLFPQSSRHLVRS